MFQSREAVLHTTTAHLFRLLCFARLWDPTCSESSDHKVSLVTTHPDVDMLCGQLVWLIVTCIAMHSTTCVDIDAIEKQLLDIQKKVSRDPSKDERHWINSEVWEDIREWLDVMTSRILSPFRDHGEWKYDAADAEEEFDKSMAPTRPRPK